MLLKRSQPGLPCPAWLVHVGLSGHFSFLLLLPPQAILVWSLVTFSTPSDGQADYPVWGNAVGWCLISFCLVWIPLLAVYKIATAKGSLWQVSVPGQPLGARRTASSSRRIDFPCKRSFGRQNMLTPNSATPENACRAQVNWNERNISMQMSAWEAG